MTSASSATDEVFCPEWWLRVQCLSAHGLRGILKLLHHSSGGTQEEERTLLHLSLYSLEKLPCSSLPGRQKGCPAECWVLW